MLSSLLGIFGIISFSPGRGRVEVGREGRYTRPENAGSYSSCNWLCTLSKGIGVSASLFTLFKPRVLNSTSFIPPCKVWRRVHGDYKWRLGTETRHEWLHPIILVEWAWAPRTLSFQQYHRVQRLVEIEDGRLAATAWHRSPPMVP